MTKVISYFLIRGDSILMFDFVFTVLAVATGVILAVAVFDGTQYLLAEVRDSRAHRAEILEARRLEAQRLRNRQIRLDFVRDGWLPPAGWNINDDGDWAPDDLEVYLGGKACPASPPKERLTELKEEADSYW